MRIKIILNPKQQFDIALAADTSLPLVIGTRNRNKGAEVADVLARSGIATVTLADLQDALEIEESGDSFAANAVLKAAQQAKHLERWVLADDSGLEVDALAGAPGVYSARFAGPNATDEANNRRLLKELGDTPIDQRTAHYVSHIALADPTGTIRAESQDVCHGRIRFQPAGANGFGYDPLFELVEYHRTFGELGPHVKQALSHRSRALRAILLTLVAVWDAGY